MEVAIERLRLACIITTTLEEGVLSETEMSNSFAEEPPLLASARRKEVGLLPKDMEIPENYHSWAKRALAKEFAYDILCTFADQWERESEGAVYIESDTRLSLSDVHQRVEEICKEYFPIGFTDLVRYEVIAAWQRQISEDE